MHHSREYQSRSIDLIREDFLKGKRKVLLWLATGGGKTFIFCRMVKEAVRKNKKCIIVVRGRKLVDQASKRLTREEVTHGVLMNKHWNYRPHLPVQVCSIDTLISRKLKPEADLIIIDEAHLAVSKGYKEFLSQYPNSFIVAVTATPYVDGGLSHVADSIVHPISMQGLIDLGFLSPFRYFAPSVPDVSQVKISKATNDFVPDQLESVMVAGQLTGRIIEHWRKIAQGKPTICFAVNIHHSKILVDRFMEAGIEARHCDADTSDTEREIIIKDLESGRVKVVSNVGILSTGVDIPCVEAIILARPTKSRNLYIQQVGRGTRPFPNKENCILLDHAGNILRHGLPTDETEINLEGKQKETHVKESKTCKECFAIFRGPKCPECGVEAKDEEKKKTDVEESGDQLEELRVTDPVQWAYRMLIRDAKSTGRKPAWAMYKLIDRFGYVQAEPLLPDWFKKRYTEPFKDSPLTRLESKMRKL